MPWITSKDMGSDLEEMVSVELQLANRVVYVRESQMCGLFLELTAAVWRPQLGQYLQAGHIEIPLSLIHI